VYNNINFTTQIGFEYAHKSVKYLHSPNRVPWYTYVGKTNKMNAFLFNNLFHLNCPRHVSKINCSSLGGVLYEQLGVFHHASYEESSRWQYTEWYLSYVYFWWWKITFSKYVEDNISEINYWIKKCASCWSFSRVCVCVCVWNIFYMIVIKKYLDRGMFEVMYDR
jgi:hypothetical protein